MNDKHNERGGRATSDRRGGRFVQNPPTQDAVDDVATSYLASETRRAGTLVNISDVVAKIEHDYRPETRRELSVVRRPSRR